MKYPKFIINVQVSDKAKSEMDAGTKFLNSSIDREMTSHDLLGCLKIAIRENRPGWFVKRLHGVFNRRRLHEERAALGLS